MEVTKHCSQENLERMLQGHFKIGTHGDYSKGQPTGLLSDTSEGTGRTEIKSPYLEINGQLGNITVKNMTIADTNTAIAFSEGTDLNLFCASHGGYRHDRHEKIRQGFGEYRPNLECTEYLVLNAEGLREVLEAATNEFYGKQTKWIMRRVVYGERTNVVKPKGRYIYSSSMRQSEIAFRKPSLFSIEEEFRFVMLPSSEVGRPKPLFVKDLSTSLQLKFAETILSSSKKL